MHTITSPHPWIPNYRPKILFSIHNRLTLRMGNPGIQRPHCTFIEKHTCINGPEQFKSMLFKSHCLISSFEGEKTEAWKRKIITIFKMTQKVSQRTKT